MNSDIKIAYSILNQYTPTNLKEKIYKEKMLEVLLGCNDCFDRTCRVGHFTASAMLLNKKRTQVLMMHHTKLNKWFQLGGHCDGDTDFLNVSIKDPLYP